MIVQIFLGELNIKLFDNLSKTTNLFTVTVAAPNKNLLIDTFDTLQD